MVCGHCVVSVLSMYVLLLVSELRWQCHNHVTDSRTNVVSQDILFDKLSVYEHLKLFAGIKGLPPARQEDEITNLIAEVGLEVRRSQQLSLWQLADDASDMHPLLTFDTGENTLGSCLAQWWPEASPKRCYCPHWRPSSCVLRWCECDPNGSEESLRFDTLVVDSTEPTSGLDPSARRQIWKLLEARKVPSAHTTRQH